MNLHPSRRFVPGAGRGLPEQRCLAGASGSEQEEAVVVGQAAAPRIGRFHAHVFPPDTACFLNSFKTSRKNKDLTPYFNA